METCRMCGERLSHIVHDEENEIGHVFKPAICGLCTKTIGNHYDADHEFMLEPE